MKVGKSVASNHRLRVQIRFVALGLVVAATVLAACGSSASTASTASSTSAASASTTSAVPVSVVFEKAINTEPEATANLAEKLGYFKTAGLNVKIEQVGGSVVGVDALENGGAQFLAASGAAVLLAASEGVPLLSVGAIDNSYQMQLVVSNSWMKSHNLSPSQTLAEKIKGLVGSKDATLSATDKAVMGSFLSSVGLPTSSIDMISMNSVQSQLAAIQHGLADEFIASPPNSNIAISQGFGTALANARELPGYSNTAGDIIITTPAYAKAHPEVVKAVVGALQKTLAQMSQGTPAVISDLQPLFPTLTPAVIKASLVSQVFTPNMHQTQADWNNALEAAKASGQLKSGATSVDVTEGTLWTNQFSG